MENNETAEDRSPGNDRFLNYLRASDDGFDLPQNEGMAKENQRASINDNNAGSAGNMSRSSFDPPQRQDSSEREIPVLENPEGRSPPRKTALRTSRKPQGISARSRSVSFDKEALSRSEYNNSMMPPNLPSVEAMEAVAAAAAARRNSSQTPSGEVGPFQRFSSDRSLGIEDLQKMQLERRLNIDDLLSSGRYETEAETNILRAFEQHLQESPNHHRLTSETSSIFSGVPDTMAHDFSTSVPDESRPRLMETTGSSRRLLEELPEREELDDDQVVPLVKRPDPPRRQKSVADQLVGFTLAMQDLDMPPRFEDSEGAGKKPLVDGGSASQARRRSSIASLEGVLEESVEVSDGDGDIENGNGCIAAGQEKGSNGPTSSWRKFRLNSKKSSRVFRGAKDIVEDSEQVWKSFFQSRKYYIRKYVKNVGLLLVLLLAVAALLFYAVDNPLSDTGGRASVSWYLLFCVRQIITLTLALVTQIFVIDFLCVSTKFLLRFIGEHFTLLVIMSRGWPFTFFMWSIYDFCLLYGERAFSSHWGHAQDLIGLFNESNPDGNVVSSSWNSRVLYIALCVSLATAVKRFVLGLYLGRQTFEHYGVKLARVLNKMLVVSQLAHVAKKLKKKSKLPDNFNEHVAMLRQVDSEDDGKSVDSSKRSGGTQDKALDMNKTDPLTGRLDDLEKAKLNQLLGQWEEPDRHTAGEKTQISISEVLRFRNALSFINNDYPFSYSFGLACSREATIRSAQELYNRLLSLSPSQVHLQFETIVHIALKHDGSIDTEKAKQAIKIFRPDREGNLEVMDFIKSIDAIYKEFRMLQASIENSSQIDRKFESIINVAFYAITATIVLSQIGVDPLALFLSFSSVLVAFAFMIGSASAKYFEGLIFVLARRPYGIGDIIHISNVEQDTSRDGSQGWVVNNVTLTQTTATWKPTLEVASFSNGSLSSSKIINWARSPNARFNINLSLPVSTNYEKIEIFKRAVEEYLKVRPREWLALVGFRVERVFSEKGYMAVVISVVHRDSWQNIGQVADSKSNFITYCHEIQKKLDMEYTAPPLPVNLSYSKNDVLSMLESQTPTPARHNNDQQADLNNSFAEEESGNLQVQQFRSMAMKKYNIRVS